MILGEDAYLQIGFVPETLTLAVGNGFTVIVPVPDPLQLLAMPFTVYTVLLVGEKETVVVVAEFAAQV